MEDPQREFEDLYGREWLEPDGLGGFASGTASGVRTRCYHALLLVATRPPVERRVLVNDTEETVFIGEERYPIKTHHYIPEVLHPDGWRRLVRFRLDPWPIWTFRIVREGEEDVLLEKEIFVPKGRPVVVVRYRLLSGTEARVETIPLLSGRDYHTVMVVNDVLNEGAAVGEGTVVWHTYPTLPAVQCRHNGTYEHNPRWYYQFHYVVERYRGERFVEDLWAPGRITFPLNSSTQRSSEGWLVFGTSLPKSLSGRAVSGWAERERSRREALVPRAKDRVEALLTASADAYLVKRGSGKTIVAGYPWFTDWGRDTFISLRGLCLATGRLEEARAILLQWSRAVDKGMMPNRFPDEGETAEFNSVDASLWFVIAANELLSLLPEGERARLQRRLAPAVGKILRGYRDGTRFNIHMDQDGLIFAGASDTQLTWMDAKYNNVVFTPRHGKPVEVEALWLNALRIGARLLNDPSWESLYRRGLRSFRSRFWNEETGCLFDVIDTPSGDDGAIRPNQIFALSLPAPLLSRERAAAVLAVVERELLTPMGLRSLSRNHSNYEPRYGGDRYSRDRAYHNGTVWPWLIGPYVEACLRVRGRSPAVKKSLRNLLSGFEAHLFEAGVGHISEIADADPPHKPRGCPFQAWSVGELLRAWRLTKI
ncbi:MAG: glycogen debranching protein [Candidatus Hydrogenedentota bacterium]|nr:MAG: glycogen debranching protein [Candidatus Hydrogenedentota bacterium]